MTELSLSQYLSMAPQNFQAPANVLNDANAYLRLFFETSGYPSAILTAEGVVVDANRAVLALAGTDKAGLVGKLFWDADWWLHASALREQMQVVLRQCMEGERVQVEVRFLAADGAEHDIKLTFTPFCNAAGKLEAIVVTGHDVTSRKTAMAKLREHEALFNVFEKNIDDLITVLDRNGRRIFNSDSYQRVLGDERVAPGVLSFDAVHPEDREYIRELFFNVVETGRGARAEYRYQLEDGRVRYIDSQSNVILDESGKVSRVVVVGRDVTERKQEEAAMQRDSALRRAIMRVATGAILYIRDRHLIWMNDGWCQMMGYTRREMEGAYMKKFYPSEAEFLEAQSSVYHEDGRVRAAPHVVRLRRSNGEIFSAQVTGVPFDTERPELGNVFSLSDITGQIAAQQEIKRLNDDLMHRVEERTAELQRANLHLKEEIAERVRYEQAKRESEEKYRMVVEHADEGLAVAQGEFLCFVNPKTVELIGRPLHELYSIPLLEFIHPEDRERVGDNYRRRLAGEQVQSSYTFRFLRPDSETRWMQISAVAVEWEKKPAVLNFLSDVTERMASENALRRSETRLHAMFNNASVALSLTDTEGHFVDVNESWAKTLGYGVDECRGLSVFDITHPDELAASRQNMQLLLDGQVASSRMEKRYLHKNGSVVWVDVAVTPIRRADGSVEVMIGGFVDITERKRIEVDTRRALEKEKELNELKSKFVTMTSHEFRTPLSTIFSSTELLEHYADKLGTEDRAEILKSIQLAVKRMTGLLEDVLLIGQSEAGKMKFSPAPLDLIKFCAELLNEFKLVLPSNLRLTYHEPACVRDCPDTVCCKVRADEKLLRRIFGNLLSNAIKYSPGGGEIEFIMRCNGNVATIEVRDQGIGIPPEDQKHLFESFHRAANVGNISGTGLGLSIVKYAVDQHGGTIECVSEPGKGTRFTVCLPSCGKD
jgi:PAS domain S-box-containing protein